MVGWHKMSVVLQIVVISSIIIECVYYGRRKVSVLQIIHNGLRLSKIVNWCVWAEVKQGS